MSDILVKQAKREEAIKITLKAEKLAVSIPDYEWLARIDGFLASQYRLIGLKGLGEKYLDLGIENAKKIEDKDISDLYFGLVFQEKAQYAKSEKHYNKSINILKQANKLFEKQKTAQKRKLFIGMNSVLMAESFIDLKQNDSALSHFNKSLKLFNEIGINNSEFVSQAFNGKGQVLLDEQKYDQAIVFLNKALKIAEAGNYKVLLEHIYKNVSSFYKVTGDVVNYNLYYKKYLDQGEDLEKSKKEVLNIEVNRILKNQEANSSQLKTIIIGVTLLLLASLFFVFLTKRNQIKENKKFKETISNLKNQTNGVVLDRDLGLTKIESSKNDCSHLDHFMSEETEQLILQKLNKFECGHGYTNSNITLSKLSSEFRINTKYLSYVINKHKKKDFNNYINELRICFIEKKLISNPEYLNYKISYLSSECGFSSHSKFSAVFKKEKGLSPSVFINKISKENNKLQEENIIVK
ncbi:AraC family transcriptional regulator [Formosa sp. L2A11]|uniref:AraC family transcriptional regulator n=1 Tax=Formosa sp. L2A11 TaxID=2686363 RepID=UPI00131CEAC6|nr:AraC family transcriptional regulator [Formosa sp. L2A11]